MKRRAYWFGFQCPCGSELQWRQPGMDEYLILRDDGPWTRLRRLLAGPRPHWVFRCNGCRRRYQVFVGNTVWTWPWRRVHFACSPPT